MLVDSEPQSVLVERYWREIEAGLADHGIDVRAFTLHVDTAEHNRRIDEDRVESAAADWRHRRRADYDTALPWLRDATTVIDTTMITSEEVATEILSSAGVQAEAP